MMTFQTMLARLTLVVLVAVAPVAAHADQLWNWSYTSAPALSEVGLAAVAQGTLSTAGTASNVEQILSITGTYNGAAILGLVGPVSNTHFTYDNMITASSPYLSIYGVMFTVAGSNEEHNLFFGGADNSGAAVFYDGYYDTRYHFTGGTFTLSAVTAVPEVSTWLLLLAGLGLTGMAAQRRRR
jgi:hypothetical protein